MMFLENQQIGALFEHEVCKRREMEGLKREGEKMNETQMQVWLQKTEQTQENGRGRQRQETRQENSIQEQDGLKKYKDEEW